MHNLQRKFTRLYTITTGLILTLIMTLMFLFTQNQQSHRYHEKFTGLMDQIQYIYQSTNMFSGTIFLQMEKENELVLSFESNGIPYRYSGWFKPVTSRETLIQKVTELAATEGIDHSTNSAGLSLKKSPIFTIHGESGELFLGQLVDIPVDGGWKNIIMVKQLIGYTNNLLKQIGLFIGIDLFGIIAVYCFSLWFVKKILKPVEESQTKQKEFIAAASHELRSPLAVIKTGVSAMLVSKEKQQEFAKDVNDEISRMSRLIDDMLLLASSQVNSWTMKMERTSLDNFLIDSYDKFLLLLQNKSINLTFTLPDKMRGDVMVDPQRLYQVISILLDNASSYTGDNNQMELVVTMHKNMYHIAVVDHGKGVTNEEKKHIFDRFYRIDQARNDKEHYGLGLSIAYEICKRMNGSLQVKDTDGGGATFVISLPIHG